MSANDKKKYYWLKLDKDFFKKHDIEIVEAMPNGKDYILFYLKLLCESISHEGRLRFSDTIPYSEDMLATVTRTNVDIVRSAIKVFGELKMIELLDDGTLYLNEIKKMIGSKTFASLRKEEYRKQLDYKGKYDIASIVEMEKKRYEEAFKDCTFTNEALKTLISAIKELEDEIEFSEDQIVNFYKKSIEICTDTNVINKIPYLIETILKEVSNG